MLGRRSDGSAHGGLFDTDVSAYHDGAISVYGGGIDPTHGYNAIDSGTITFYGSGFMGVVFA